MLEPPEINLSYQEQTAELLHFINGNPEFDALLVCYIRCRAIIGLKTWKGYYQSFYLGNEEYFLKEFTCPPPSVITSILAEELQCAIYILDVNMKIKELHLCKQIRGGDDMKQLLLQVDHGQYRIIYNSFELLEQCSEHFSLSNFGLMKNLHEKQERNR